METLNTLISRHSVRTYTGESLSASDLEKILKAADCTPVGMGLYDQIHLTVVNNRDFIANADTTIAAIMHTEGTHPTYNVLGLGPVILGRIHRSNLPLLVSDLLLKPMKQEKFLQQMTTAQFEQWSQYAVEL